MPRTANVRWPTLPILSLRMDLARAAIGHADLSDLLADQDALTLLGQTLGVASALGPSESSLYWLGEETPPPLDVYKAQVSSAAGPLLARQAHWSALAVAVSQALTAACRPDTCGRCARLVPASPHHCLWKVESGALDAQTVESRGECLSSVRELFTMALQVASNAYGGLGVPPPAVRLSTGHAPDLRSAVELHVNAVTEEGPPSEPTPDRSLDRTVQVIFDSRTFDIHDYLALPYVLLHECIAHAFCGAQIDSPEATLSTAFHEGWMDQVAAEIIARSPEVAQLPGVDDYVGAMETVRAIRMDLRRHGVSSDVVSYCQGARAYEAFVQALVYVGNANDLAREAARHFSLGLNASPINHEDRGRLVVLMNKTAKAGKGNPSREYILSVLEAFSKDLDWVSASDRLVAWHPHR